MGRISLASHWTRRTQRSGWAEFPGRVLVTLVVCVLMLAGCGPTGPYWEALASSQGDTIVSLAQDPSQTKILYAGANHGVIYRTRTDGISTPVGGEGLPASAQTNALLPDPHAPGVVYAATTSGLYVTTDDGNHWSQRGTGLPRDDVLTALIFGASDSALLAGTFHRGVYTSADQGHTWTHIDSGLPGGADINTLFHDPASQVEFAGLDGGGLYVSVDGGQTWAQRTGGLASNAHVYVFAETPARGTNPGGPALYIGTAAGLYASANDGTTWTQRGAGQGLPSGSVRALAADPKTPGVLYAAIGSVVYGTTDGGAHWTTLAPGLSQPVTSLVVAITPSGKPVIFAGAGQLQRFPAIGGTTNTLLGNIIAWGFIILVFGLGFFVIYRTRIKLDATTRNMRRRLTPLNRPPT